jgi:predicted RNA-binding protein
MKLWHNIVMQLHSSKAKIDQRKYWLIIMTPENFKITRDKIGCNLIGLSYRSRKQASLMSVGDKIVYYITQLKKYGAIVNIESEIYEDSKNIWISEDKTFPLRMKTKTDIVLSDAELKRETTPFRELEFIKNKNKNLWGVYFRTSMRKISKNDFTIIRDVLNKAKTKT